MSNELDRLSLGPISRRALLKGFGFAAAALWAPPVFAGALPSNTYDDGTTEILSGLAGTPDRVIVIGAGFAGLAAANALQQAGVDVVVLEARERLGGRAWTADIADARVDLGCSWIHGPIGNTMTQFAEQASIGSVAFGQFETIAGALTGWDSHTGGWLTGEELFQAFLQTFAFEDALYDLHERFGPRASVGQALRRYLKSEGLDRVSRRRAAFAIRRLGFEAGLSAPIGKLGLDAYLGIGFEEEDEGGDEGGGGEDVLPIGGYTGLVDALGSGLGVRTGEAVREVRHGTGGVEVDTAPTGAPRDAAVTTYTGSHVLVTVPLGVLKGGSIRFSPKLPAPKRKAIRAMGFGSFEKVVLRFDEAFWRPERNHIAYLSKRGGEYPIFLDMTDFTGLPTLATFTSAKFARSMRRRSDEEIEGEVLDVLTELFGTIPSPVAAARTNWQDDPFARGCYSYGGRKTRDVHYDDLTAPVGGRVLFAGEATNGSATSDGAMESGIREAKRLLGQANVQLQAFG